jgi:hypothetical protein
MDPITLAIIAAIAVGLAKGAGDVAQTAVGDAYRGLKQLLVRKFGHDSDVVKAVDAAEAKPDSEGRKTTLSEEVEASGARSDPEIITAAERLIEQLGGTAAGGDLQVAIGSYIAQAAARGHAQVNVGVPPSKPEPSDSKE